MKARFTILAIMFLSFLLQGQEVVPSAQDLEQFFKSKTYVVVGKNPMIDYNTSIEDAVKSVWTLTEYEFITEDQFEQKQLYFDADKSFIMNVEIYPEKDEGLRYDFLAVLLGGAKSFEQMHQLALFPLAYYEDGDASYGYMMPAFVRFAQKHIQYAKQNPKLKDRNVKQFYNKRMKELSGKKLLLTFDQLDESVRSVSKIKKIYPGEFEIVEEDYIAEKIEQLDTSVVFAHVVRVPEDVDSKLAKCYVIILDAAGNIYYYNRHKVVNGTANGLYYGDFVKMAKNMR